MQFRCRLEPGERPKIADNEVSSTLRLFFRKDVQLGNLRRVDLIIRLPSMYQSFCIHYPYDRASETLFSGNGLGTGRYVATEPQNSDSESIVELRASEDVKEVASGAAPENNPRYTTVYVGNLAPEVTQVDLHRHLYALGAGSIKEVRIQRNKGFGFVRYSTHAEAAMAISLGNAQSYLYGKQIKCSWGNKPTPAGTSSNPLPPPTPASLPGFSSAELLSYERQIAFAKMGGIQHQMHLQGQPGLRQTSVGMGGGASQATYNGVIRTSI